MMITERSSLRIIDSRTMCLMAGQVPRRLWPFYPGVSFDALCHRLSGNQNLRKTAISAQRQPKMHSGALHAQLVHTSKMRLNHLQEFRSNQELRGFPKEMCKRAATSKFRTLRIAANKLFKEMNIVWKRSSKAERLVLLVMCHRKLQPFHGPVRGHTLRSGDRMRSKMIWYSICHQHQFERSSGWKIKIKNCAIQLGYKCKHQVLLSKQEEAFVSRSFFSSLSALSMAVTLFACSINGQCAKRR